MSTDVKVGDRIRALSDSERTVANREKRYYRRGDEGTVVSVHPEDVLVQFENQAYQHDNGRWYIALRNLEVVR